jgi:hypothetical protein
MKFLKHMSENLFITFTGIAALVHSTWSLGTMFSGQAPAWPSWDYLAWVLPAFFVAFAMDIGQISTSAAIRHNGLTWQRGFTFFVFALATYYLQFLYIAHHLPLIALAPGISETHRDLVKTSVDAAIWILPLLLPLATMLYTISGGDSKEQIVEQPAPEIVIEKRKNDELPAPEQLPAPELSFEEPVLPLEDLLNKNPEELIPGEDIIQEPKYLAHCDDCGWEKEYEDPNTAKRALNTHKSVHCGKGKEEE